VSSTDHLVSSTDHLVSSTDHLASSTDHLASSTDHLASSTDHLVSSTDHLVSGTDHLVSSTDHSAVRYAVCEMYVHYNSISDCDWADLRNSPVARNYATEVSDRGNEVGKVLTSVALCGYFEERTDCI